MAAPSPASPDSSARAMRVSLQGDEAAQWSGSVYRVEALPCDEPPRLFADVQRHPPLGQPLAQLVEHESTMRSISGWVSGMNSTMSSTRLRNSGRKCRRNSPITSSRPSGLISPEAVTPPAVGGADVRRHDDHGVAEVDGAALRVGEPAVVEHCSSVLNTSACAFSISSKSTTEYGLRRTASVSWPPSS